MTTGVILSLLSAPAHACDPASSAIHELDPKEKFLDTTPPAAPKVKLVAARRVDASEGDGQSCTNSQIQFHAEPTSDDRTPTPSIGYRMRLHEGQLPPGLVLPTEPLRALDFGDGSPNDRLIFVNYFEDVLEPFSFAVTFTAVDLAGNESAPGEPVSVKSDGVSEGAGCSLSGRQGDASGAFGALLLALGLAALGRAGRRSDLMGRLGR